MKRKIPGERGRAVRRAAGRWFRRHKERLLGVLAAVLVCTAALQCVLLWKQAFPQVSLQLPSLFAAQEEERDDSTAAYPVRFVARGETGVYGVSYHTESVQTAYEKTAEIWRQALEHAGTLRTATQQEYSAALKQELLMLQYDGEVPAELLAGWLGCTETENLSDASLGVLALCREDDGFALYIRDSGTGTLRRADTSVSEEDFAQAVGQFEENGSSLAVDTGDGTVAPDILYGAESMTFEVMSFAAYTGDDGLETLLTAFGLQAEDAVQHAYETGDETVYVSGENSLRLRSDGRAVYTGSGIGITSAHGLSRRLGCVGTGYELTAQALEAIGSGASPSLIRAYTDGETGQYIAVFGIQINGVPADNEQTGYFARYAFENGMLVRADLALRTCQATGETVALMPEKQAAASLSSAAEAVLSLRYTDQATDTLSAWSDAYVSDETTETTDSTEELWGAEDDGALSWDEITSDTTGSGQTAWYDNTGTAVTPRWYVLQYGERTHADVGRTFAPEDIVVVKQDFDRLIQGGGAE